MSDVVKRDLYGLIDKELEAANQKFPLFNSTHEAFAVILEEAEEAKEEAGNLDILMNNFWIGVKEKTRDAYYRFQCGRCERCMAEVLAGARRVEDINPGIIVHHKKELTPENINDPAVALSFDNLELLCDEHHNRQHKAKAKRYTFDAKGNLIESK